MTAARGRHGAAASDSRGVVKAVAIAVGILVLIALLVLGYVFLSKKMDASRKLDRATVLLEQADSVLVEIDEVVSAEITPTLAARAVAASKDVDSANEKLSQADSLVDEASPSLRDKDRGRADALQASVRARMRMLQSAPELLQLNEQSSKAMPLAREGWAAVIEADAISQRAVAGYNKLTKQGVTDSQRLNKQAGSKLATARERFVSAEEAFSAAPFELYIAYVDRRISINKLSQATDTAWLAGEIAKANTLIRQYNVDDPKAVAEFKKLPSSPDTAIGAAYDTASAEPAKAYYEARDEALEADRKLK